MARFQVINFSRSQTFPSRWFCRLGCGHDAWVTRSRRPILGTTLVECPSGCKAPEDPMKNGPLMLDVTEER